MKRGLLVAFTLLMLLLLFAVAVSARSECVGRCYVGAGCEGDVIDVMNCSSCISRSGYWKPFSGSEDCFNTTPYDLCLDYCVACCNGTDDDGDGGIDYPNDAECTCGLDPSEQEKLPPIPELSTLLLMSVGLLVLALVLGKGRKKE